MNSISFNTTMTLKSLAFISDSKLRQILTDILSEIDNIVLIGASRSTLYLSMSTLEGILSHLIEINIDNAKKYFPKDKKGRLIKLKDLTFDQKINISKTLGFIENEYQTIFVKMKKFRNYMHPDAELRAKDQIDIGASQISLGILNHILNTLGRRRFIQGKIWNVISGEPIYESSSDIIEFKKSSTRTDSFIVTKDFVGKNIIVEFILTLSSNSLLNFVYNFESDSRFNMLRFDARNKNDNGFLECKHYAEWDYLEKFNYELKRNLPNKIRIECLTNRFVIKINNKKIKLNNKYKMFDKNKEIGFFNELNSLTVNELKIIQTNN